MSFSSNDGEEIILIEVQEYDEDKNEEIQIKVNKNLAKCGRKLALDWNNVIKTSGITKCKHCNFKISPKVERIRNHLLKCAKYKQFISKFARKRKASDTDTNDELSDMESEKNFKKFKAIDNEANGNKNGDLIQNQRQNQLSRSGSELPSTSFASTITGSSSSYKNRNSNGQQHLHKNKKNRGGNKDMSEYVISTTSAQKRNIDEAVAECFYASNVPFEKVEHPNFLQLMGLLRPGYKPPSRKQLAGELLDTISSKVEKLMTAELDKQNRPLTLLQDGWSSIRNDPIIATSIHTGKSSFLLSTLDCEAEKKTSDFCLEVATDAIQQCESKFGKTVFAFCTDNENKMVKMRNSLKITYPDIITYGCSAHYLNLLEKEITPKTEIKHIVEINKFFRNHHQPHGLLKQKPNSKMPQLPNDTRWNSQIDCMDSFVENYMLYREIVAENPQLFESNADYKSIKNKINNIETYTKAVDLKRQLMIVSFALDKLQSDNITLSDAVQVWLSLLSEDMLEPYRPDIKRRYDEAITVYHQLAYYMDPKYFGRGLSYEEEQDVEDFIRQKNDNYLADMLSFKVKDVEMYPRVMFEEATINKLASFKWWEIVAEKSEKNSNGPHKDFCMFMSQLLSCPASSAALERIFSTFGHVWSKLRNSLKPEKVDKLVKIYRYLNNKNT